MGLDARSTGEGGKKTEEYCHGGRKACLAGLVRLKASKVALSCAEHQVLLDCL